MHHHMGTAGRQLAALAHQTMLLQLLQIPVSAGGDGHLGRQGDLIPLGECLLRRGWRLDGIVKQAGLKLRRFFLGSHCKSRFPCAAIFDCSPALVKLKANLPAGENLYSLLN